MVSFEVFRADVFDRTDVVAASFKQPYRVAPQPVILRLIAVAFRYLIRLPTPVKLHVVHCEVFNRLKVLGFHHRLDAAVRKKRLRQSCRVAVWKPPPHAVTP